MNLQFVFYQVYENGTRYMNWLAHPSSRDSIEVGYDRVLNSIKRDSGWVEQARFRKTFNDGLRQAQGALERLANNEPLREGDKEKLFLFFEPDSESFHRFKADLDEGYRPDFTDRMQQFAQNVKREERVWLADNFEKIYTDEACGINVSPHTEVLASLGYPILREQPDTNMASVIQDILQNLCNDVTWDSSQNLTADIRNEHFFRTPFPLPRSPSLILDEVRRYHPNPFRVPHSSLGSAYDSDSSPLIQFDIRDYISLDGPIIANLHISLTNISIYLVIAAFTCYAFNLLARNYNKIFANLWSISLESIYATVHSIVINQINSKKGQAYFPFIFTLFLFILASNLMGMIPYSFAATSHFILTFYLSFAVVLGATILGLIKYRFVFFSYFVPTGCPLGLLPLLVLIESISYLARNVSLGLRLAANVLSGHMLLNILSGFAYNIMTNGIIYLFLGLIALVFIMAFSGLELGIAFIQAQVFVVLTCSYIKDALELH